MTAYYDLIDGIKIYKDYDDPLDPDLGKRKKFEGQEEMEAKKLLAYLIKQNETI